MPQHIEKENPIDSELESIKGNRNSRMLANTKGPKSLYNEFAVMCSSDICSKSRMIKNLKRLKSLFRRASEKEGKMNIYYNFDLEIYEEESTLVNDWKKYFSEGYETFSEFLKSCMWYNNGNLQTLSERRNYLNTMLNRLQKQEETEKDDFLYYEKELKRIANIEETERTIENLMQASILFYSMNNDTCYDLNSKLIEETEKILEDLLNND